MYVPTMVISTEEVSSSLVREYLSRKGLRKTIACMDEEHPRTESSINNRSHLRQILNMESLYRDNKVQSSPLKTLLEIIVKHHIAGHNHDNITSGESAAALGLVASPAVTPTVIRHTNKEDSTVRFFTSEHVQLRSDVEETRSSQPSYTSLLPENDCLASNNQTPQRSCDSGDHKGQPLSAPFNNKSVIRGESEKNTESTQRSKMNRIRRGMMAGPIASAPQESNKKRLSRRGEAAQLLLRKQDELRPSRDGLFSSDSHSISSESGLTEAGSAKHAGWRRELLSPTEGMQSENSFEKVAQVSLKTTKVKTRTNLTDLDVSVMVLDDIDDDDDDDDELQGLPRVSFQRAITEQSYASRPMDQRTAMELKILLLGSSQNCFSVEWRNQGFTFSETHDLRYGIVQKKGGPCGVLASIQAFVLKKMLFENTGSSNASLQSLTPSSSARRKCLVLALAEILWRAGKEKRATVAVSSGRSHFTPSGRYKSEGVLEKITLVSVDSVEDLKLHLEQHIEQFETGGLGCILLTISAVLSRSIDKVREDMDVPTTTLIGAHGYCTQELVNLLLCGRAVSNVFDNDMELDSGNGNITLLKGIKSRCDVGLLSLFEHYNICKRELLTNLERSLEFDLYYYDGLANQQEEIRLTVSVGKSTMSHQDLSTDLTPPLEHCIQTRWPGAFVSWNDTEPIL
ncbi:probable ubiquitin carboxyl-terminal hydrolase MINDY-4 isoform X2 [Solea solea]|uniref:probable ubiquitin carboxyl-terminal hydrolase MINDY-4 isoform X2 n=1 Tax=Solea solea TaxID=90069 RepID=UPI00272B8195|nr:probable ubiquitin carboxyl-terminal hydrolase MINDY-4 isoform X2 [Solea solea]